MSLLQTYFEKKRALEALSREITALEQDDTLKRDLEFAEKLKRLVAEYGTDLGQIISIIDPANILNGSERKQRRSREKVYINPRTSERVVAKTLRHPILKAWISQYGKEVVDSWVQPEA